MHFKLIVQFEMKSIMIIKFNMGVFVFTEKIQVTKLGHHRLGREGLLCGKMATIHVYLLNKDEDVDDPTDSIIYGPSTSNKT